MERVKPHSCKCGETDPAMFDKDNSRPSGLHPYCKKCRKNKQMAKKTKTEKIVTRRSGVVEESDIPLIRSLSTLGLSNTQIAKKFDVYANEIDRYLYKKGQ